MPAVPVAQLPSQELKPQQSPGYTPEDFGAGTGRAMMQVGQTLQNSSELIARHVEERANRDNETKILNASTKLSDASRDLMYGENGVLTTRGEQAAGSVKTAQEKFDAIRKGLVAEFGQGNPLVAAKVDQMAQRTVSSNLTSIAAHEASQGIVARDAATENVIKASSLDAGNSVAAAEDGTPDPVVIQRAIGNARAAAISNIKGKGGNEEAQRLAVLNADTAIHGAVIDGLLAKDPLKAQQYYLANKGSINGSEHARLQTAIKTKTDAFQDDADTQRITGQSAGVNKLASSIVAIDVPSSADYVTQNLPKAADPDAHNKPSAGAAPMSGKLSGGGEWGVDPAAPAPAAGETSSYRIKVGDKWRPATKAERKDIAATIAANEADMARNQAEADAEATRLEGDVARLPDGNPVPLPPKRPASLDAAPAAAAGPTIDTSPGAAIPGSRAATNAAGSGAAVAALAPSVRAAETGANPNQVSPKGAAGSMQIMPDTAREISAKMLKDGVFPAGMPDAKIQEALRTNPALADRYGKAYLSFLSDRYHGDVEAVLVGYNAGPGNADKWLAAGRDYKALPKPSETEPYVSKVLSHFTGAAGGAAGVQQRAAAGAGVTLPPLGRDMTKENWSLSFYKPEDMLAPTGGGQHVDARAATMADILGKTFFDKTGIRVAINDVNDAAGTAGKRRGTADPADNPHVANSQHIHGRAFDFQIQSLTPEQKAEFLRTARSIGFTGVGFYDKGDKAGHLHLDAGSARTWGDAPGWAQGAMATAAAPMGAFGISGVVSRNDAAPAPVRSVPGSLPVNLPTGAPAFGATPAIVNSAPAGIPGATPDASVGGVGAPAPVPDVVAPAATTTPRLTNAANEKPTPAMLTAWEAEAMQIADPTRRASVLGKVRAEYQRRVQLAEQGQKSAYEAAFAQVVQKKLDPKDIPGEQLAAMGPEKAKAILDWHATMKKAEEPKQDWETWGKLSQMSDNELKSQSPFDYRAKLDDAHFDKLTDRFKAITTKSDEAMDLLKGVSDRKELIREATAELAGSTKINDWEKKPENMRLIGQLNSKLDAEITAYTRQNKKAPDAEWQRKTLDRLLVKVGTTNGWTSFVPLVGSDPTVTRAFQVEPETAADQVKPEASIKSWKDIPTPDRVAIKSMWMEGAGKPPSEGEMIDLSRQIVRARLGAPQVTDPPAHEKTEVVNALKKKLGRDPSTVETREFWGRILQDKFGGK